MHNYSFYESTGRGSGGGDEIATRIFYSHNYSRFLPTEKQAKIVELGCSEGVALEWLFTQGFKNIVGIDSDKVAISLARERLQGSLTEKSILCLDALTYLKGCKEQSIEIVIMFNIIEHIPKAVLLEMIPQIRRVLKDGGMFLVQTGNMENPFNIGLFSRDFTHEIMFTKNSLRQLMIMSGFSKNNIHIDSVSYKTTLRNLPYKILSPLGSLLVQGVARSMRMNIRETASLIYCCVRK